MHARLYIHNHADSLAEKAVLFLLFSWHQVNNMKHSLRQCVKTSSSMVTVTWARAPTDPEARVASEGLKSYKFPSSFHGELPVRTINSLCGHADMLRVVLAACGRAQKLGCAKTV